MCKSVQSAPNDGPSSIVWLREMTLTSIQVHLGSYYTYWSYYTYCSDFWWIVLFIFITALLFLLYVLFLKIVDRTVNFYYCTALPIICTVLKKMLIILVCFITVLLFLLYVLFSKTRPVTFISTGLIIGT